MTCVGQLEPIQNRQAEALDTASLIVQDHQGRRVPPATRSALPTSLLAGSLVAALGDEPGGR